MQLVHRLSDDRRGAALVEFAIALPVLATLLLGILGYGQYFLLAHSTQQLANDAARATVAGLSEAERLTIANATLARQIGAIPDLKTKTVSVAVEESADLVTVRVRVDASAVGLFSVSLLPMPDPVIERHAIVRAGGVT